MRNKTSTTGSIPTAWQMRRRAMAGMLFLLNRSRELSQLIAWAGRKKHRRDGEKFARIQLSYKAQQLRANNKLWLLRARFPRLYYVAWILHGISNAMSVKPGYYRAQARARQWQ